MGVFLTTTACDDQLRSPPHARGGVSDDIVYIPDSEGASPRPWGCFLLLDEVSDDHRVLPTPVGVFLSVHPLARR